MIGPLAVLAVLGLSGLLLWRRLAPRLVPLPPGGTWRAGVLVALLGLLGTEILTLALLGPGEGRPPLLQLVTARSLAAGALAGLVLLLARRRGGVAQLGLRRPGGPPAPLVALAAWLAFLPVLAGVAFANDALHAGLGQPRPVQAWIAEFLASPEARGAPAAWAGMAVILPACEELFFRGGLHGALRRVLPLPAAVALSALGFGLVHEPSFWLPTAALGAVLAVLYERSGSLAAPVAFHALHNGAMLALVSAFPQLAA